jgi:predicted nucleic acid-binding protein
MSIKRDSLCDLLISNGVLEADQAGEFLEECEKSGHTFREHVLDTNVLSETRKARPSAPLMRWLLDVPRDERFISVLTLGELARGATLLELRGRAADAAPIRQWTAELNIEFSRRTLMIDHAVMSAWAEMRVTRTLPLADSLIAATALAHGLTVATRNTTDFQDLGVRLVNPFDS